MSASNLSTVIGPSICFPPQDYPTGKMMQDLHKLGNVFRKIISNGENILASFDEQNK